MLGYEGPYVRTIAHPITGTQVGVLYGESDGEAVERYNLTVLGYTPTAEQMPGGRAMPPSPSTDIGPTGYEPPPPPLPPASVPPIVTTSVPGSVPSLPSQTPPPPGGAGPVYGGPSNGSGNGGGIEFVQGAIYRLILETHPGRVDTGATYPLCSRYSPDECKPVQFPTVDDAIKYAYAHNEIPVLVGSVEEVWDIVEGRKPVSDDMILQQPGGSIVSLLVMGALAYLGRRL